MEKRSQRKRREDKTRAHDESAGTSAHAIFTKGESSNKVDTDIVDHSKVAELWSQEQLTVNIYRPRSFKTKLRFEGMELAYIKQWRKETYALAYGEYHTKSFALIHRTEFDPENITTARIMVDFIFVPESARRNGIASFLLHHIIMRLPQGYGICAVTSSDDAESFFLHFGFQRSLNYKDPEYRVVIMNPPFKHMKDSQQVEAQKTL